MNKTEAETSYAEIRQAVRHGVDELVRAGVPVPETQNALAAALDKAKLDSFAHKIRIDGNGLTLKHEGQKVYAVYMSGHPVDRIP